VHHSCPVAIAILLAAVILFAGCNSDPYCQNAIANLRAEKIQMENQYYELKARYESDMARLGQPLPAPASPVIPGLMEGEIIYEQGSSGIPPITSGTIVRQAPRLARPTANAAPAADMARYIRSIEVVQLPPRGEETVRLLLRPLDDEDAILPMGGDVKMRLYNPVSGTTVFESEFPRETIEGWINDQPGQQPGIHISLLQEYDQQDAGGLICDLQFRTADNRILKHRTPVRLGPQDGEVAGRPVPAAAPAAKKVSTPIMPEDSLDSLNIEIGEELNFDSLEKNGSRPGWRPDR
jgi:hypothetical protein